MDLDIFIDERYWDNCFSQIYTCTISPQLRAFQYQFLHRIIYTYYRLQQFGIKDSKLSSLCNEEEYTMVHFFDCAVVQEFWL